MRNAVTTREERLEKGERFVPLQRCLARWGLLLGLLMVCTSMLAETQLENTNLNQSAGRSRVSFDEKVRNHNADGGRGPWRHLDLLPESTVYSAASTGVGFRAARSAVASAAEDEDQRIEVDFNSGSFAPLQLFNGTGDPPNGDARYTVAIGNGVARHQAPGGTPGTPTMTGFLDLPAGSYPISGDLTVEWTFPNVADLAALGNNRTSATGFAVAGLWIAGRTGQWNAAANLNGFWGGYYWSRATGPLSVLRQGQTNLVSEAFTATTSASYRVVKTGGGLQFWARYDGGPWHQVGANVAIPLASPGNSLDVGATHIRVLDNSGGAIDVGVDNLSWSGTGIKPPAASFLLTVQASDNGTVDPAGGMYPAGTIVQLKAVPNPGYRVAAWSGTNDDQSLAATNTVTLTADRTVSVRFTADETAGFPFRFGAQYADYAKDIYVNAAGEIFVTGYFQGTVDFDPGPGVIERTAQGDPSDPSTGFGRIDIFLAKYSAVGRLEWVRTFGGPGPDMPHTVRGDARGNLYLTGYFSSQADFDSSSPSLVLDAGAYGRNVFLAKFDSEGRVLWARGFGDAETSATDEDGQEDGNDLAIDPAGNVYVTGFFNGSINFDPARAGDPACSFTSAAGSRDIFAASFDTNGTYRWGFALGAEGQDHGAAIRVAAGGSVFLSGFFSNSIDFDPGPGVETLVSAGRWDVFLAKYDKSGAFQWASRAGGTGNDQVRPGAMECTPSGGVLIAGSFQAAASFGRGGEDVQLVSAGSDDAFLASYDANSVLQWVNRMGGTGLDFIHRIAVDSAGGVYVSGSFVGEAGFDPRSGGGVLKGLGVAGASDAFAAKYSPQGAFAWVYGFGGASSGSESLGIGTGIAADSQGNVFVAGRFHGAGDFAPGAAEVTLTSAGAADVFVARVPAELNPVDTSRQLLLSNGRVRVTVEWRNQYSGESGVAYPIPRKNEFGYFYFSDAANPEVFVKVLDFGSGMAQLFAGALTNFYYRVTFTTVATGQTVIYEKPAGSLLGFADGASLSFMSAEALPAGTLQLGPDVRSVPVPAADPQEISLSRGRITVTVSWRSPYSSESGNAYAIVEQDSWCFFYFSDRNNPEVFVKVLDFGSPESLLFAGGLTDFEYTVTYTNSRGEKSVFTKPAGTLTGYANSNGVKF